MTTPPDDASAAPSPMPPVAPPAPIPALAPLVPPRPPRVWTVFLAFGLAVAGAIAGAVAVYVIAAVVAVVRDPALAHGAGRHEALRQLVRAPGLSVASMATTSTVLAAIALLGAALSPQPTRARLGLVPARLGLAVLGAAAIGGVLVSSTFDAALGALGVAPTGAIEHLAATIRGASPGVAAWGLLAIGVVAPVAEELLFRGYVQTRLCARWGAWPGVLLAAALFGALHLDRVHSPSAFVVGVYLGWLALRSGSVVPAIVAHVANNVAWFAWTRAELGEDVSRAGSAAALAAYVAGAVAVARWLAPRLSPPRDGTATEPGAADAAGGALAPGP